MNRVWEDVVCLALHMPSLCASSPYWRDSRRDDTAGKNRRLSADMAKPCRGTDGIGVLRLRLDANPIGVSLLAVLFEVVSLAVDVSLQYTIK